MSAASLDSSAQASVAPIHSSLEDTQHLLTQHCYILDRAILYGVDLYALWSIYNIPSWDSLGAGSTDTLRNNQKCLQTLLDHETNPC